MKILLDACVWGKAKERIAQDDHDVIWAGDWDEDPGDLEILERAHREGRLLVTLDKDFGELAIVRRIPHSGIMRLVNISAKRQAEVCVYVLDRYREALENGAILTVESNRVRIRPPD
jgi:predicted nuclease of predicted toxin-antitoxin system